MKSEMDIEILMDRMEKFVCDKAVKPGNKTRFNIALHVLAWVLEKDEAGEFSSKADEIVATVKGSVRRRIAKRIVQHDHFPM